MFLARVNFIFFLYCVIEFIQNVVFLGPQGCSWMFIMNRLVYAYFVEIKWLVQEDCDKTLYLHADYERVKLEKSTAIGGTYPLPRTSAYNSPFPSLLLSRSCSVYAKCNKGSSTSFNAQMPTVDQTKCSLTLP